MYIGLNKGSSMQELKWGLQKSSEAKGFPTRQAESHKTTKVEIKHNK